MAFLLFYFIKTKKNDRSTGYFYTHTYIHTHIHTLLNKLFYSYSGTRHSAKFLAGHRPPYNPVIRPAEMEFIGLFSWFTRPRWGKADRVREGGGESHNSVLCRRSDKQHHNSYNNENLYAYIFLISTVLQNKRD